MRRLFATWLGAALLGGIAAQGVSAQQKEYLRTGESLGTNQYLVSSNRNFFAIQQGDGNLCVYRGSGPGDNKGGLWCNNKTAPGGQFFTIQQGDGNLCVYRGTGPGDNKGGLWCNTKTAGGGQFFTIVQNDGNLCSYRGTGPGDNKGGLWCHNTNVGAAAPAAPPRRGVTVVNKSASFSWITIYSETVGIRTIKKAGCLQPGQENSWSDVPIVAAGAPSEKIVVRVERTKTANCAALSNNAHVTCDTAASWDKLGGLESISYTRKPYVVFTFNDGCYIDTDR